MRGGRHGAAAAIVVVVTPKNGSQIMMKTNALIKIETTVTGFPGDTSFAGCT